MAMSARSRTPLELDHAVIDSLRASISGQVLTPNDRGYDEARRVWNALIDRYPAVIVRSRTAADVQVAVTISRDLGLELSIKGGGHNVAGKAVCDGGVMIDLSSMKRIETDPAGRTVRAEPGVLWEELDAATSAHGLATVGGVVGTTGIAGLTLGGGQGWLNGKYGLTLDNLLSADVVLADGRQVRASATENPDLFWALRGAGANFGIVTSFEYRLHPVTTVLGGLVVHTRDRAHDVLKFYREFASTQPDELTTYAALLTLPDGAPVVALVACYTGDLADGEHVLAPLRGFGQPVADTIAPIPYTTMQGLIGPGFPHGRLNYWKSGLTDQLSDRLIDAVIDYGNRVPSPHTAIVFADVHGAARRVAPTATAYGHRDLQFDLVILSAWTDHAETERNITWTRELYAAVEPELGSGVYVNDLGDDDGTERVRHAYGVNYPRLSTLKQRYDPGNLFHQNQNIPPATTTV